jgi:hypothetical protein
VFDKVSCRPRRGSIAAGQPANDLYVRLDAHAVPAGGPGNEDLENTRVPELRDRIFRQPAQALGFFGTRAKSRHHLIDTLQHFSVRRGCPVFTIRRGPDGGLGEFQSVSSMVPLRCQVAKVCCREVDAGGYLLDDVDAEGFQLCRLVGVIAEKADPRPPQGV